MHPLEWILSVGGMLYLARKTILTETGDIFNITDRRDAYLAQKDPLTIADVETMAFHTERIRRVTWRIGVIGAMILATLLVACRIIPWEKWFAAAVPGWIAVTAVINFRAFHLEDEQTLVLRRYIAEQKAEAEAAARHTT